PLRAPAPTSMPQQTLDDGMRAPIETTRDSLTGARRRGRRANLARRLRGRRRSDGKGHATARRRPAGPSHERTAIAASDGPAAVRYGSAAEAVHTSASGAGAAEVRGRL